MDCQLGVMIDVEEALYMFMEKNLYSAGLAIFSALGYPIEPLEIAINESMSRFVYVISENHCIFSSDETNAMQRVASISWLFVLNNDISALRHVREARIGDIQISSINYFCVELSCTLHNRSIQAFNLTKIISKVVNTPVVVLFKHVNRILLSSVFIVNEKYSDYSKTYLSDWYLSDPVMENVLMTLSDWHFGNYCDDNFHTLFMDFSHSMARHYFFYPKSVELLKYGRNSIVLHDYPSYDEIIFLNVNRHFCLAKLTELTKHSIELNPSEFYEYDYVNDEERIEILANDHEWMLEELFDMDDVVHMIDEADLRDDDEESDYVEDQFEPNDLLYNREINRPPIDIDNIDDAVFNDPIKMLEYLESLDQIDDT